MIITRTIWYACNLTSNVQVFGSWTRPSMTDEDGNYDGNGEYEEENDGLTQELQDGRWRRYSAEDGGYYFHNFHTGESIWDPPDGWVDPPGRPTIQPDVDPEDEEPLPSLSNHPLSPPRPEPDSELGIPLTQEPLPSPFNHPLSPPRDSEFHTSNYNNNNGRVSPNVRASTTLEASSKLSLQEQDELRAGLEKQTGFQRSISSLRNLTRGASFTAHNTMTNLKRAHSNHTSNGYQHHKNEGSISENNSDTMRPSVEGSVDSIPLSGAGSNAPIHRQPTSSSSANSSTTSTSNQQKPPDLPKTSEKSSFTDSCTDCCDCSFFEVSEVPSVPVLTLESQPSCYPEEKSYFRKLYPALSITSVGPQLSPFLCAAGTGANYTLDQIVTGQGFLVLNGQSPSVSFGSLGTSPAYGFTGCQPIKLRKNQGQVCTGFNFSLPVNSSATDAVPSIVVTNPTDPKTHKAARVTTCSVTRQGWLMLVSKPSVLTLQPAIGCDNTSTRPKTTFTVTGQTAGVRSAVFLRVKTKNSTVWTYPTVTTNSGILGEDLSVADCSSYEMDWSEQAELCETLSFDLWSTNLPMKNFVKISNPRGGSACATDFEVGFLSLPPSKIDDATPKVLCWESGTQSVIFTGRFYSQDKKPPTLEFEGLIVEVTGVSNCTTTLATGITGGLVPNDAVTLEKCTTLTANITPDLSSPLRKAGGYIQPKAISTPFSSCGASNKPLVIISSQVSGFKQRSGLDQNDIYLFYGVQPGMFCPRQTGITTFLVGGSFASIGTNRAQFYIGTNQYTPAS
eukprot:g483.t1